MTIPSWMLQSMNKLQFCFFMKQSQYIYEISELIIIQVVILIVVYISCVHISTLVQNPTLISFGLFCWSSFAAFCVFPSGSMNLEGGGGGGIGVS